MRLPVILIATSSLLWSTLFFDKGTIKTLKELSGTAHFINIDINDTIRIDEFNRKYEEVFKFKTKPYKYTNFLQKGLAYIPEKKMGLIRDIALESGKYILATGMNILIEGGTVHERYHNHMKKVNEAQKVFIIRYAYILKNYEEMKLLELLEEYKSKQYQEALKATLKSIYFDSITKEELDSNSTH